MDYILQLLFSITSNPDVSKVFVIGLISTATFALCLAVYFLMGSIFDPVRKRLHTVTGVEKKDPIFISKSLKSIGDLFIIESDEKLSEDRLRLLQAGYQSNNALANFYGIRILMVILCPITVFALTYIFPGLSVRNTLLMVVAGLAFGYIAPSFYLDKKLEKRQRIIRNSFPDAIDQLIVCVEAGLGLDAGIQRVARDTALSNPIMGYELGLVSAELRAGVERDRALKNLVERTGVLEIQGLVAALAQSLRFGSSIAETLRIYSDELRDKRMQRAEEEAAKLSIKMLFPLAFCFFPGLFIVILGPAAIAIQKAMGIGEN